jgi:hypothetical protein
MFLHEQHVMSAYHITTQRQEHNTIGTYVKRHCSSDEFSTVLVILAMFHQEPYATDAKYVNISYSSVVAFAILGFRLTQA